MAKRIVKFSVKELRQVCLNRQVNKYDGILAITGERGSGKSTIAYHIAKKIKGFRPKFDLIYDLDTLKKRLEKWDKIVIVDEAIYTAYKREWQKKGQIELIKQLNAYRDHRNIVILCIPTFWDLDKPLRQMCFMRVDVIKRGTGVVHKPLKSNYTQDNWDSYNNEKVERVSILGRKRPRFQKLSTFKGYIKFRPLSEKEEDKYQKIKNEQRNNLYEKEKEPEIQDDKFQRLIKGIKNGLVDKKFLDNYANMQGIQYNGLAQSINRRLKLAQDGETLKGLLDNTNQMQIQTIQKITPKISKSTWQRAGR